MTSDNYDLSGITYPWKNETKTQDIVGRITSLEGKVVFEFCS